VSTKLGTVHTKRSASARRSALQAPWLWTSIHLRPKGRDWLSARPGLHRQLRRYEGRAVALSQLAVAQDSGVACSTTTRTLTLSRFDYLWTRTHKKPWSSLSWRSWGSSRTRRRKPLS